jgi:hypothetical protein
VLVRIPRTVQKEVDQHKQAGNSRRARRARKASSLFREILGAPELRKVVREVGPRVELSFPPLPDPNRKRPRNWTWSRRTTASSRRRWPTGKHIHPGDDVRLLTHDTNPMLTARQCDLPFVPVPDSWLLEPEPDERDKQLAEFQRRLSALERDLPVVGNAAVDADDKPLKQVQLLVDTYVDLGEPDLDRLVKEVQARHPIAETFDGYGKPMPTARSIGLGLSPIVPRGHYERPTQEEIAKYRDEDYPNWLKVQARPQARLGHRIGGMAKTELIK